MSRYIEWADVNGRYPRITTLGGADEIGSDYIDYAEVEIEGRLTAFSKPFSNNNLTVRDLCIDMTYAKILTTRESEKATELRDILSERINNLNGGREAMVDVDGNVILIDNNLAWSETENYHPVFGAGDIIDAVVDSSRIYDEEQAKL